TMEEYIRLEEEKSQKCGKVFNWETARYGKIWYDEDVHDLRSVEIRFPAIVFNDSLTSMKHSVVNPWGCYSILLRIYMCPLAFRSTLNGIIRMVIVQECCGGQDMAPLRPRDQRHMWICYQVVGYTKEIIHDFEQRLETIFGRQVNRVHILDFEGFTPDMRQDLAEKMRIEYTRDDGQEVFVSHTWRRLFGIRAPLVQEFIHEFIRTCRIRDEMGLDVAGLHTAEEMAEDEFGAYWHIEGRKNGARLFGGYFIGRLTYHFGLAPQSPPPTPAVGRTMPRDWGDMWRRFRDYVGMLEVYVDL
nr:hypothetical protein [Tanacetum cinerariifolium]